MLDELVCPYVVRILGPQTNRRAEHRSEWGRAPTTEHIQDWALNTTSELVLGHLDLLDGHKLVFGIQVLHGELSEKARKQLINAVAWRADAWEAALTGADRR